MCGIAGIINGEIRKGEPYEPIREMTDIIAHRGPDGMGYYIDDSLAFGHRRLSIIDLSELGHQPMEYLERYVITYNGEVYNYIELRKELEERGYAFRSHTDTEVILAAYDHWKDGCLDRFNGMFSFAIYDREEKTVFCARDRFGVKPFYYTRIGKSFAFGSEIKQFTVLPSWRPELNEDVLVDFLVFDIKDHNDATFFKDVFQLKGGHCLSYVIGNGQFVIRRWYNPDLDKEVRMGEAETESAFRDLFYDSVRLRLRSDVKVGSCLSGGVDSSSIVSVVNELLKEESKSDIQEVVTSCFKEKQFDEQEYVDDLVQRKNIVSHKVYPAFNDLMHDMDKIVWHQDEPFGSTSVFAQWNVFKSARSNDLKVMLDGQGADEILCGYPTYFGPGLIDKFASLRVGGLVREVRALRRDNYSAKWIAKEVFKNLIGSRRFTSLNKRLSRKYAYVSDHLFSDQRTDYSYRSLKQMSFRQVFETNLPMLLHYEDRDSMAFSIESRVPFLDYRLVEFCYRLPDRHKIDDGVTKVIIRKALRNIVPEKIFARRDKMGFVTPEKIWMKENAAFFRDELNDAVRRLSPYVNEKIIDIFEGYLNDSIPFDFTVWKVVALNRWMKVFNISLKP
jgi:asparagine synthase (glutamine-hydrolysing)